MIDDPTLLRRYAAEGSEAAFAEFVRRHLPFVYSVALRRLNNDAHRAEDVAQVVFSAVARDAHRLAQHAQLTAWLYTATRNAVIDVVRTESRRRVREAEAHLMNATSSETDPQADWSRLRPVLDAAMDELSGEDREAVLLRFFQGRPFAEIGTVLKLSEDTARKRVERAVDKLRALLQRHGIASTSAAFASLLASETMSAAPASLAATITGAALATGGVTTGVAASLTLTKLQLGLVTAVIAGGTVGLVTQHRALSQLRQSNASLQADLAHHTEESARLAHINADTVAERVQLRAEVAALKAGAATAGRSAITAAPLPAKSVIAAGGGPPPPATTSSAQRDPVRLAQYRRRFDEFVRQRGLTPEQADKLFGILGDWDDASRDFQALIRTQGLVWTPEAQQLRNRLQQQIEVEPLIALLGHEGKQAYFEFESSSFYRALVEPISRRLAHGNLPLTDDETARLVTLAKANLRRTKPDPSSMGSEVAVDWQPVLASAVGFLNPSQVAAMETAIAQLGRDK